MIFTKKFFAAFFALVQVSQAMPGAPYFDPEEPYIGKSCDRPNKVRCNENGKEGPNNFKVRCENNVWVKDEVCNPEDFCGYYPGFDKTYCTPF
ncbi:hypothetical protein CONCODRAFT_78450, partial [Conidiobolus coronatus NRRL 28638]